MKKKYGISERKDSLGNRVLAYGYGDVMHSAVYLDPDKKHQLVFPYNRAFLQAVDLFGTKGRVLVIGGGMYTLPAYLIRFYPDLYVDVLEPMTDTVPLAKRYFGLNELYRDIPDAAARLRIIPAFGREYLAESGERYDIIINDAFSGSEPAYDLISREAAELIHQALNSDGIYAANILGSRDLPDSDFMLDEMRTLLCSFAYTDCDEAADEGTAVYCNYIVFASDRDYFRDPSVMDLLADTQIIEDRDLPHLKEFYEVLAAAGRI